MIRYGVSTTHQLPCWLVFLRATHPGVWFCIGAYFFATTYSVSVRGMATEKQIMMRINATKNISKITQSMKMVSAAKLRGDQARLEKAQPFNVSPVVLAF